jgi:hypothetical protein
MKAISALLALTFSVISSSVTVAQVSIGEFVGSALQDPEVQTFSDQIKYLDGKPYRLAPIRDVQFRTQNRELLSYQQEFGLRISPSNPFEVRRHNQYFREFNTSLGFEKEFALKEALISRYTTVIEYIYYTDLLQLNQEGTKSLEEQLAILEKQSGSSYFDPEDFVDLKFDMLDYSVDLEELQFELSNQVHRVARTYAPAHQKQIDWNASLIISPDGIRQVVDSLEQLSAKASWLAYQEQKIKVAQSQYRLEKNNFNLGFIQGAYDFRRFNQDRNPISISAGLTLPLFNPNKGDMARRKLDIIEAEYDLKEENVESETDKRILLDKLRSLIDRIESLDRKVKEIKESNLPMTLSSIRGGDPVVLIQFTQNLNKMYELSHKVKREMLLTYIEYLAFTDHLQKQPLVNFFSSSLSPIANK